MHAANKAIHKLAVVLTLTALATGARAAWPEKPIRVVIPYPPGGAPDIVMRSVAEKVAKEIGQPIVVDNREGAAGNIGATLAARAAPDGYTLLLAATGNYVVNHLLYRSFGINPLEAFTPVIRMFDVPAVLVSSAKVPAGDFNAFTAYAKEHRGTINFGSPGYGTTPHIALETLSRTLGMDMTGVTYRGAPPALNAVVAGDVHVAFAAAGTAAPFVQKGRLRPLAVASAERIALLPNVPTFRELGLGHIVPTTFWVLSAPSGTPDTILDRLNGVMRKALETSEMHERLEKIGVIAGGGDRQSIANLLANEATYWSHAIKEQGIKPLD